MSSYLGLLLSLLHQSRRRLSGWCRAVCRSGAGLSRLPSSLPASRAPGPFRRPLLRLSLRQPRPRTAARSRTGSAVPGIAKRLVARFTSTGAVPTAPAAAEPSPAPPPNGCTIEDRFCCPWHRGEMPARGKSRPHSPRQRGEMPTRGKSRPHSPWQRQKACCRQRWETRRPR